ncbi:MAG: 2-oxoacid:acceptor oxidoreductase subunit alpha [Oligoflexia bacterium]|nr:2-oxoacid:acceptor oxidoreductase subunit alpha [Oligoflexia bacterium]
MLICRLGKAKKRVSDEHERGIEMSQSIINDCSITVATVNGSGSQSANNILLKTLFRMGIPVGAKNLFPSNIQGLPTWYTIRVNKNGFTARKRDLDICVALNPATWSDDLKSVKKGGVMIYNSEYPLTSGLRDDLLFYPVPFKKLAEENFTEVKLRKLLTNMIYVGVLTELLGIDVDVLKTVVNDSFASKQKVVESNFKAIQVGIEYAKANIKKTDPYRVEKMDQNKNKIVIDGNTAAALGCVYGGCSFVSWYPITPSSSLCEATIDYFEELRVDPATGKKNFAVVQAEDELAALGMALGAGWAGARAMTATSGPGISLMAEFTGFVYFTEIPAVIFDIQRVGPSTGLPTRTAQGDIESTHRLSHGDKQHPLLLPANPVECFDFAQSAFDLADRLQTPVFVMSDLDLGMNQWVSDKFKPSDKPLDRGKVLDAAGLSKAGTFGRYRDVDGDGICYRTLPGTDHPMASYFVRGSGHNEDAKYTEKADDYARLMDRLKKKYATAKNYVPKSVTQLDSGAKVGILAYGSTDLVIPEVRELLKAQGLKTSYLRLRALPFGDEVTQFFKDHDRVYIVEQNRDGQMDRIVRLEIGELSLKAKSVAYTDGLPLDAHTVVEKILSKEKGQA